MSPRTRAVSPVIGTIMLILLTVMLAAVIGTAAGGTAALDPSVSQSVAISVTAEESGTITVDHVAGDPIDLAAVDLRVSVDGQALEEQPPVPFFVASGFEPGPTGAFNSGSDGRLSAGERGSVTLDSGNAPALEAGSTVRVRFIHEDHVLASAETSVRGRAGDGDEG